MTQTVLVVEDNTDLAYGLRNNLEIEGYRVLVEINGSTGLATAKKEQPDLMILDLMLPEMDGFRVLRSLRQDGCDWPILILTARGEEADKVRGLRLGADDYVTKPFGVLELLARVEALLRRSTRDDGPDAAVMSFGSVEVDMASRSVTREGRDVPLAPKEYDLLLALLQKDGAVVTRFDLMNSVWSYQADVSSRTVDTHIAELRRKLEDNPGQPQYILTVRKAGYRLQS